MKSFASLPVTAFLMCMPFSFSTRVSNNLWMEELKGKERKINGLLALTQWLEVYHALASDGAVFVLPALPNSKLQDLPFVANIGSTLPHLAPKDVAILANFTSEPRQGEEDYAELFFKAFGFDVYRPLTKFEGEADLKYLRDDIYLGGYGIRTDFETHMWLRDTFAANIIPLKLTDEYLYHLDCSVFPLTKVKTMVCTEVFTSKEVKEIEKVTEIIPVTKLEALSGICNSVRSHNLILNHSNIHHLSEKSSEYKDELWKNRKLEDIANTVAFEVEFVNISEFMKGGALLSCMIMHLNKFSYNFVPALEKTEEILDGLQKGLHRKEPMAELQKWLKSNTQPAAYN